MKFATWRNRLLDLHAACLLPADSTPAGQKYLVPPSLPDAGCLLGTELPLPDLSPLISGLEVGLERIEEQRLLL